MSTTTSFHQRPSHLSISKHMTVVVNCPVSNVHRFCSSCHFHRSFRNRTTATRLFNNRIGQTECRRLFRVTYSFDSHFKPGITFLAWCPNPLCFLPEGLVFAQAFLLPEADDDVPDELCVAWIRRVGSGKIKITCTLTCLVSWFGGQALPRKGRSSSQNREC